MNHSTLASHRQAAGFTLLEVIVVLSIITLLIGIAVPSLTSLSDSENVRATRSELENLRTAVINYASDTETIPATLARLWQDNTQGWGGPYVDAPVQGKSLSADSYDTDAWGNLYQYIRLSATQAQISSYGPNGLRDGSQSGDDLELLVDITPALRQRTQEKAEVLNGAIDRYNSAYLPGTPLPTTAVQLVDRLQATGYLPPGNSWFRDAFGDFWQLSGSPVSYVFSSTFGLPLGH